MCVLILRMVSTDGEQFIFNFLPPQAHRSSEPLQCVNANQILERYWAFQQMQPKIRRREYCNPEEKKESNPDTLHRVRYIRAGEFTIKEKRVSANQENLANRYGDLETESADRNSPRTHVWVRGANGWKYSPERQQASPPRPLPHLSVWWGQSQGDGFKGPKAGTTPQLSRHILYPRWSRLLCNALTRRR